MRNKKKVIIDYCDKCDEDRALMPSGCYSCPKCGEISCYRNQKDFIPEIWMKCQKSVHKQNKWFEKVARKYVA